MGNPRDGMTIAGTLSRGEGLAYCTKVRCPGDRMNAHGIQGKAKVPAPSFRRKPESSGGVSVRAAAGGSARWFLDPGLRRDDGGRASAPGTLPGRGAALSAALRGR